MAEKKELLRSEILLEAQKALAAATVTEAARAVIDEYRAKVLSGEITEGVSAEELAAKFRDRGKTVYVCDSIPDGIAKALELAGTDGMVCAAGSLYSVGEIRYNFGLY